jgi:methionine aminotransferase
MMRSKLPDQAISIFAIMSGMAREYDAINLAQGFPDFDSDPELIELVSQKMRAGLNQYAPMPGVKKLRSAIKSKIEKLYGLSVNEDEEVTVTAGATQALFNVFSALVHRGDEVVILEPAYDCYVPSVVLSGGVARPIPIVGPDFDIPWDKIEAAFNNKTRMLVLTNPHNPLGKVMKPNDIERLRALMSKYDFILVSDEVYEHLTYDGHEHLSILKYPELYARTVITYSFGKTFHNTGWKMGYTVAPKAITDEIRKVHQFNVFAVNTPIQHALAEYMIDESKYLSLPEFFQNKRDLMVEVLRDSRFKVLDCEGSYFMLVDYSQISDLDDMDFARWLTIEHGVATIPLSPFYTNAPQDKVVRLCFAKKEETLRAAAEKLRKV